MEARFSRVVPAMTLLAFLVQLGMGLPTATAAGYKTTNFVVSAPTPQLAKEIGDAAEMWRKKLAIQWLGKELPPWSKPCPIHARVAPNIGAGGATSFVFDRGEVFGWKMNVQGSRERVLDSVLPHEITHTIFASHFRQPLPRWADEGASTTVEHPEEIAKQEQMLVDFLKTGRGIPFSQMFAMKEYPPDVMPLYAQGHSLAQWLIENRGRKAFLEFLGDGMKDGDWPRAVHQHYGFTSLHAMQDAWLDWVKQGRPQLSPETSPIAQLVSQPGGAASTPIYRGQSPDQVRPTRVAEPQPATIAAEPDPSVPADESDESVYAAAAARARQKREAGMVPARSGNAVYDASRDTGVRRR